MQRLSVICVLFLTIAVAYGYQAPASFGPVDPSSLSSKNAASPLGVKAEALTSAYTTRMPISMPRTAPQVPYQAPVSIKAGE